MVGANAHAPNARRGGPQPFEGKCKSPVRPNNFAEPEEIWDNYNKPQSPECPNSQPHIQIAPDEGHDGKGQQKGEHQRAVDLKVICNLLCSKWQLAAAP